MRNPNEHYSREEKEAMEQELQDKTQSLWKIRINDGYCEWEFELPATIDASIADVYELVRKRLGAFKNHGKLVK